jgi:MFS family permease
MHTFDEPAAAPQADDGRPWWRLLGRYHWFVLIVASLGWLFDTMDQQLFTLARRSAMTDLARPAAGQKLDDVVAEDSGYATSIFLIGWGIGGIGFGIIGDLLGRVRALTLTILLYSIFTGLSALSVSFWDFALYRFLTGLGVGGEFGVGVSLVAETMPDRARPFALGLLQALSAIGNITAAVVSIVLASLARAGTVGSSWRIMFVVGTVPALLCVLIMRRLQEPERWQKAAALTSVRNRLGAYWSELLSNPRWSRNAVVGLLLASSGIIGLWGIGFFSYDLLQAVFQRKFEADPTMSPADVKYQVGIWAGIASIVLNAGAFFGINAFSWMTARTGRKPAFAVSFVLAMLSTALVFWQMRTFWDVFWMVPLMGFCQLALFGGYAIYFPELFPTRLRSTGTSFCYNGARFLGAAGPTAWGLLTSRVFEGYHEPIRWAGVTMCAVFLIGLAVLPFAPETKGQPLPE